MLIAQAYMIAGFGNGFALHVHVGTPWAGFTQRIFVSCANTIRHVVIQPRPVAAAENDIAPYKIRISFFQVSEIGNHTFGRLFAIEILILITFKSGAHASPVIVKANVFAH